MKTLQKVKRVYQMQENYQYHLAVSSDTLYVVSMSKMKIIDPIIIGIDKDGLLLATDDLDAFLDAISILKNIIESKRNPLDMLLT